jgi:streptogramin lyase
MHKLLTLLGTAALVLAAMSAIAADKEPTTYEPKTKIGRPPVLKGPNGIFVHPNGNVYAASVLGDEIIVPEDLANTVTVYRPSK